jgi:hypothetical protein
MLLPAFSTLTTMAHERPVGLGIDRAGALLIADDGGNTVWRVWSAGSATPAHKTQQNRFRRHSHRAPPVCHSLVFYMLPQL